MSPYLPSLPFTVQFAGVLDLKSASLGRTVIGTDNQDCARVSAIDVLLELSDDLWGARHCVDGKR